MHIMLVIFPVINILIFLIVSVIFGSSIDIEHFAVTATCVTKTVLYKNDAGYCTWRFFY